ncbi:MAG: cyclopropane-fatty-acyl-phospholipid synthase family protein [Betaproteobacteria bacterium]
MPATMRAVLALLPRLSHGALALTTPDGATRTYGNADGAAAAALAMRDWSVATDVVSRGDVGFAEAYIDGRWDTPDLVRLLTLLAANQPALERAFYGRAPVRALLRLKHLLRANTRWRARKNIVAHYDLGNAFYALWLDPTMTYSSALFHGDFTQSLEAAQRAKYARAFDELALPAGGTVLEIGCGWGGFAEHAALGGARVTGISLSKAQTAYARTRAGGYAGLPGSVDLHLRDYRDVRERYDAVASIEMIEAVGERWWPAYFRAVHDALNPAGRACIQAITIADARFDRYRAQSDFIQQYIFPGGMLPSPTRLVEDAAGAGLALVRVEQFGHDYAETLKRWLATFDAQAHAVRALGFDARFIRCWRFYLAYCAAGFATGTTDVAQYTFARR